MLPKLILTDIDGVWTDGGMYYDEKGNELKKFNTYDSAGVLFCKLLKIPVGIITGEAAISVKNRANKLKVDYLFLGIKDKQKIVKNLIDDMKIDWKNVAYLGDDINDFAVLSNVGISACPSSAPSYIKSIVNWTLEKKGGEGVFREFVERIITENNISIVKLLKKNNVIQSIIQ